MVLCGACGLGCCAAGACCGAQASGKVRLNYALLLLLASLLSTLMMASWARRARTTQSLPRGRPS
jgi:hypothetical protein